MSTGFIEAKAPSDKRREGPSAESPIFTSRLIAVMAAVCLAALALAAFGRLTGVGVQKLPQSDAVLQRELRFLDAPGGVIVIQDASDGAVVHKVVPGDGGFIRTVIRGMAHERMAGAATLPRPSAWRCGPTTASPSPIRSPAARSSLIPSADRTATSSPGCCRRGRRPKTRLRGQRATQGEHDDRSLAETETKLHGALHRRA